MSVTLPGDLPVDLPIACFDDADAWERWLSAHGDADGVWLKIAKKGKGVTTVTYAEALDVALCHGWIDGQKRSCDAVYFLQRFTPRRARSLWSRINIGHVERLTLAGRMKDGGLQQVERAKGDGRWDAAYAGAAVMQVPDELQKALGENDKAMTTFQSLDKTNRYAVCWRVHTAKKPETRLSRARSLAAMLANGETIHPVTRKKPAG